MESLLNKLSKGLGKVDINISITNNRGYKQGVGVMGSPYNTINYDVATTEYRWDLTGYGFNNDTAVTLQYRAVNTSQYILYTAPLAGQDAEAVAIALNGLNIGPFTTYTDPLNGQLYVTTYNYYYEFGQLGIVGSGGSTVAFYANGDLSVTDLSGNGFNGVPIIGDYPNEVPTTLQNYNTNPFGYLEFTNPISYPQNNPYAIDIPNLDFTNNSPFTVMTWFTNSGDTISPDVFEQGLANYECVNAFAGFKLTFTYSVIGGQFSQYAVSGQRYTDPYLSAMYIVFGSGNLPAFDPTKYYFVMYGFDNTTNTSYLSMYGENGIRYDAVIQESPLNNCDSNEGIYYFSVGKSPVTNQQPYQGAYNGNLSYFSIYDSWVGYTEFDNIYLETKARYGY